MYFLVCRSELACNWGPGRKRGTPIRKGRGCSSEILFYTPKGDQSGRCPTFFDPKETILNFDYMNRVNKTN